MKEPMQYSLCFNYSAFNPICQAFFLLLLLLFSDFVCLSDNAVHRPYNRLLQVRRISCINDFSAVPHELPHFWLSFQHKSAPLCVFFSCNNLCILSCRQGLFFFRNTNKDRFQAVFFFFQCCADTLSDVARPS